MKLKSRKNKKFKNTVKTVICLLLCVVFGLQGFAFEWNPADGRDKYKDRVSVFDEKYKNYYMKVNVDEETEKILGDISPEIDEMLDYYVEYSLYGLDRDQAVKTMIRQFLWDYPDAVSLLGESLLTAFDPFGGYYPQITYGELFSNEYVGYGVVLGGKEMINGNEYYTFIKDCFYDSPAYKAGIKIGDEIIKIDGINVEDMGVAAVSSWLGFQKDKITLTVRRNGKEINISMSKQTLEAPSISVLAYEETRTVEVKVANFTDQYMLYDIFSLFDWIVELGFENIIIDLRDNLGGDLMTALEFLNMFVPEAGVVLCSDKDKDGNIESIESSGDGIAFDNICVITNGYSASASEIFALSLKEIAGAVIIGEQSYGKGVGQYYIPLKNGDTAAITAFEILSSKGTSYHGAGIEPDIILSPEYIDAEKQTLGQLNFVNCVNIKKDADNKAVLSLNQRLAQIGYISPDDITSVCTDKTVLAVEIFQKYNDLPVGINKIDYIFLEYLDYYARYYSPSRYQERDVQLECAEIYINEGKRAAVDYAAELENISENAEENIPENTEEQNQDG